MLGVKNTRGGSQAEKPLNLAQTGYNKSGLYPRGCAPPALSPVEGHFVEMGRRQVSRALECVSFCCPRVGIRTQSKRIKEYQIPSQTVTKLSLAVQACDPTTQEAEAGRW